MDIVHLIEGFGGGAAKHVIDLAGIQARRGHRVRVIPATSQLDPQARTLMAATTGVTWIALDLRKPVHPQDALDLLRIASAMRRPRRPAVLHCHCNKAGLFGMLLGPLLRLPVVYTPHAFFSLQPRLRGLKRNLALAVERSISRCCTTTILLSRKEADFARAEGFAGARFRICPNGIGQTTVTRRPRPDGEPVIGFLGRLSYQKGIDLLLAAERASRREGFRIEIHGFGPHETDVQAAAAEPGSRISFHGPAAGPAVMERFDILVMPSRYEGFPYVLLEALVAGLPIIATDVGGVDELVRDGWNGVVLHGDPLTALIAELDGIAARDWRSMGGHSALLAGIHTAERMADRIDRVYGEALARPAPVS